MNMHLIDKVILKDELISRLKKELQDLTQAAKEAHLAAVHEENKAEDKHDTRGIEASYLAGAQAQRVKEIKEIMDDYSAFRWPSYSSDDAIDLGALVELSYESKRSFYLLMNKGGGVSVMASFGPVLVVTPHSPLGEALIAKKITETVEVEVQRKTREYEVVSIF